MDFSTLMMLGASAATPLGAFATAQLRASPSDVSLRRSRRTELGMSDYLVNEELLEPNLVLTTYGALGALYEVTWEDTSTTDDLSRVLHGGRLNAALLRCNREGWMHQAYALKVAAEPLSLPSFIVNDAHRVLAESHIEAVSGSRYGLRHLVAMTYLPPAAEQLWWQKMVFSGELPVEASYERVRHDFDRGLQAYEDGIRRVGSIRRLATHPTDPTRNELLEAIFQILYDEVQPIRVGEPFEPCPIGGLLAARDIDPAGVKPKVGSKHLRVLSVFDYPSQTQPGMMDYFMRATVSGCRFATRSLFQSQDQAKSRFDFKRRTWAGQKTSAASKALPGEGGGRVNRFAALNEEQTEEAILAIDMQRVAFVHFSAKLVFLNEDLDDLAEGMREATKAFSSAGLVVREETVNTLDGYFGHLPFDGYHDVREGQVHTANVARLWATSSAWPGRKTWNCNQCGSVTKPMLVGVTDTGEDFFFDPHDEDTQSFIAIGAPGCGKSTDANTFAGNYRRAINDQVFGIDKNRGMLVTTMFLGGDYREDQRYSLFADLSLPRRIYLVKFLGKLAQINNVEVVPNHLDEVKKALERMVEDDRRHRCLSTFLGQLEPYVDDAVTGALAQYAVGGVHDGIFDGVGSYRGTNSYEVHELGALLGGNKDGLVAAPVLLWILNSFEDRLPGHRTIILVDEAWSSLRSPLVAELLDEQMRTLRFRHAGIGFFTHSLADIKKSAIASTVFAACKTRLLYPNPEASTAFRDLYEDLDLTPAQIDRVKTGVLKRDCNLSANGRFGAFRIPRSAAELAVYGCTGYDEIAAARRLMLDHPDDWRERHLRSYGCDREADRLRSLRRQGTLNPHTIGKALVTR